MTGCSWRDFFSCPPLGQEKEVLFRSLDKFAVFVLTVRDQISESEPDNRRLRRIHAGRHHDTVNARLHEALWRQRSPMKHCGANDHHFVICTSFSTSFRLDSFLADRPPLDCSSTRKTSDTPEAATPPKRTSYGNRAPNGQEMVH